VRDLAVECRSVVKQFYIYTHRTTSLREWFIRTLLRRSLHVRKPRFSVTDFDLEVARGEAVALIGPNGSGKSTALRLIAGIYRPTEGYIRTVGRLTAVIELGSGLHDELTGLENVRLYGSIMGWPRQQMSQRLKEVVDYADVGPFLDTPVKFYSSGMRARLCFAVAFCLEPEILLVDESLSVGDEAFQQRCLETLRSFHTRGGTLILVSHDLRVVNALCSRAVWLEHGRIRKVGPVAEVVDAYHRHDSSPAEPTVVVGERALV
jgi:ABC-type polysaccharide/polyol phosphate transport system ATPase subunit